MDAIRFCGETHPQEGMQGKYYPQTFSSAADCVDACFRYWCGEVCKKRLENNIRKFQTEGKCCNYVCGHSCSLGRYYRKFDFDNAGKYLTIRRI